MRRSVNATRRSGLLAQLMDELAEAKSLLETRDPIVVARKSTDPYVSYDRTKRMNYYAVCALRARIALYTGDYATAYDEAKTVVESEKFRFITAPEIAETDSYGEELRSNRVFTPELVFALDNDRITASARALLRRAFRRYSNLAQLLRGGRPASECLARLQFDEQDQSDQVQTFFAGG